MDYAESVNQEQTGGRSGGYDGGTASGRSRGGGWGEATDPSHPTGTPPLSHMDDRKATRMTTTRPPLPQEPTDVKLYTNPPTKFDDGVLARIASFADAFDLLKSEGLEGENFSDYGTGFKVTEKSSLVGTPMILLEWRFNPKGKFGDFVSVLGVTKDGRKVIINDGSPHGICKQLRMVTDQRMGNGHSNPQAALLLESGLSRSDYDVMIPNKDGEAVETPATTYYLSE